jgi:hypothetical protein
MRTTWMLGGVLGFSAVAIASPNLNFQTVIYQGQSIAGDQFDDSGQVVVAPNGSIGIVGVLETSGNEVVIYSTGSGNSWTSNAVAETYTPAYTSPDGDQFETFANLAMTQDVGGATRLTFAAQDTADNSGILQWDTGTNNLGSVAFDGDSNGYSNVGGGGTDSGFGLIEMQVNGSGQVMFPATTSTNIIGRGNDLAPPYTMYTSGNPAINDLSSRVALGTDNTGVALLSSGSTPGIYSISAAGGITNKISGSYTPATTDPVMGYYSNGTSAALMLFAGSSSNQFQIGLSQNGGAPTILVPSFTASGSIPQAEMAPSGKIAMYIPDTSGDRLLTADATSGSPTTKLIASVYGSANATSLTDIATDPGNSDSLKIYALTDANDATGPEINSSGTVVFTGDVGNSSMDTKEALMDWVTGDASPEILLAVGDTVTVDGQPVTIQDFSRTNLSSEDDYYKNALNDQNEIAVNVDYTLNSDPSEGGSAVLVAVVPEPTSVALVSLAGIGLMARRRRC